MPLRAGGKMRLLATNTTSLPLNFFSSSRTRRGWILWKDFSRRKGTYKSRPGRVHVSMHPSCHPSSCELTCTMMALREVPWISISLAAVMYRSRRSAFSSWLVASRSNRACRCLTHCLLDTGRHSLTPLYMASSPCALHGATPAYCHTWATDSSNSSASCPRSFTIFLLRAVNTAMVAHLRAHAWGLRCQNHSSCIIILFPAATSSL